MRQAWSYLCDGRMNDLGRQRASLLKHCLHPCLVLAEEGGENVEEVVLSS